MAYQMEQMPVILNDPEGHYCYLTLCNSLFIVTRRPPPSSFCHPMRLSDFIDFISVKRERDI